MQSEPSSKRLEHHQKLFARVSQPELINKIKSQDRNKVLPLLGSHPHSNLGLHSIEFKGNLSQGLLLLQ